jgi:methylenetetrahydrofolate--tRNA-(uracil-5-)-methyltransferase
MRPKELTPAHTTGHFAELVCSNSLKSKSPESPAGQLKAEMAALGSIVLETALENEVPAGQALGVDRDKFGEAITEKIRIHPLIEVVDEVFTAELADSFTSPNSPKSLNSPLVLATGPLTTPGLSDWIANKTGKKHLYFYDAVSPTVDASTIDFSIAFHQSRYDKGEGDDYINCPFNKDEYDAFVEALVAADRVPLHAFEAGGNRSHLPPQGRKGQGDGGKTLSIELDSTPLPPPHPRSSDEEGESFLEKIQYFAGCMPIEAIAERGHRSLAFGNFKPVGLTDPRTGRRPWAALQLRPENKEKTLYSLVACQNRLRFGEQKRVFQMVPGLQNVEFVRYGVIHRNTFVDAPSCLTSELQIQGCENVYIAGQLTGVEGYVESAAMGQYVGLLIAAKLKGQTWTQPPRETALGSLLSHLQDQTERDFAPMNINWGLFPDPEPQIKDKGQRKKEKIDNARRAFEMWAGAGVLSTT